MRCGFTKGFMKQAGTHVMGLNTSLFEPFRNKK